MTTKVTLVRAVLFFFLTTHFFSLVDDLMAQTLPPARASWCGWLVGAVGHWRGLDREFKAQSRALAALGRTDVELRNTPRGPARVELLRIKRTVLSEIILTLPFWNRGLKEELVSALPYHPGPYQAIVLNAIHGIDEEIVENARG